MTHTQAVAPWVLPPPPGKAKPSHVGAQFEQLGRSQALSSHTPPAPPPARPPGGGISNLQGAGIYSTCAGTPDGGAYGVSDKRSPPRARCVTARHMYSVFGHKGEFAASWPEQRAQRGVNLKARQALGL